MSEFERLKYKGKLLETEQEANRLRTLIDSLVQSLRNQLDRTIPQEDLDGALIMQLASELSSKWADLHKVLDEIKLIRREL